MASNPGLVEDQLLLRIQDPELAAQFNQLLLQQEHNRSDDGGGGGAAAGGGWDGVQIEMHSDCEGVFNFRDQRLPVTLVDLPTVVETHKSPDNVTTYKSGDLHQMLLVQTPAQKEKEPAPIRYPHGLTPPAHRIRPKRFERVKTLPPSEVRNFEDVLKRIQGSQKSDVPAVSVAYDVVEVEEEYFVPGEPGTMLDDQEQITTETEAQQQQQQLRPSSTMPPASVRETPTPGSSGFRPESAVPRTPLGLLEEAERDVLGTPPRAPPSTTAGVTGSEESMHLLSQSRREDGSLPQPETSSILRPPSDVVQMPLTFGQTSPSRLGSPEHMFGGSLLRSVERGESGFSPMIRPDSMRRQEFLREPSSVAGTGGGGDDELVEDTFRISSMSREGFPPTSSFMGTPARDQSPSPTAAAVSRELESALSSGGFHTRPLSGSGEDVRKTPATPLFGDSQEHRSLEHRSPLHSGVTPGRRTPLQERAESPSQASFSAATPVSSTAGLDLESPGRVQPSFPPTEPRAPSSPTTPASSADGVHPIQPTETPEPVAALEEESPEIAAARKALSEAVEREEKEKASLEAISSVLLRRRRQKVVDAAIASRKAAEEALSKLLGGTQP